MGEALGHYDRWTDRAILEGMKWKSGDGDGVELEKEVLFQIDGYLFGLLDDCDVTRTIMNRFTLKPHMTIT